MNGLMGSLVAISALDLHGTMRKIAPGQCICKIANWKDPPILNGNFMETYGKIIVLNEKNLGKLWKTMENYNFEWENYGTTIGKL